MRVNEPHFVSTKDVVVEVIASSWSPYRKLNVLEDKHFRASEIMHRKCFTALATVQVVTLQESTNEGG